MRQLENLRFGALNGAKGTWQQSSARWGGYHDRVEADMIKPLNRDWSGLAADMAMPQFVNLGDNYRFAGQESVLVETLIDGVVTELQQQQKNLAEVLDKAARTGFRVSEKGEVNFADEADIPTGIPMREFPNRNRPEGQPRRL
ncbi:hypothetical protein ACH4FX_08210 [Streptomyces sp. NPDC018019]|uniref:hypothetical protein n=1 Tax=Streptomyces sp. NPDC018019 TaxID=3365030 RepID=UPI0037A660E0